MDHIARVKAAIKRQPVDRTPCAELVITDELVQTMFGQEAIQFEHRLEFVETMGLDAVCLHPDVASQPEGIPSIQDVAFCDLEKWVNTDLFTFAVLDGSVGWGNRLLGFEELMRQLVRRQDNFLSLMTAVEQMNMSLMDRLASNGVKGILIADDIAFNQGVIARPAIMRQLLFPSLARQVEHAKRLQLPVFFHSDGNLDLVLEDIAAAGFDGLQCIESLAQMDIGAIKDQYGDNLCLWGNLDPAELIEARSLSQLEASVKNIIAAAGRDSGLIFGTSSGLFEKMRLDSIQAVYRFAREFS